MAADDSRELGAERKHDGATRGNANYARVEHARQGEHAGVLAVRSVGRRAEQRRQDGGQAVAEQRAMQTGIGDVVALAGRADGRHIADMLDHGGEGQRHDGDDGRRWQDPLSNCGPKSANTVLSHSDRQTDPRRGGNAAKNRPHPSAAATGIGALRRPAGWA